ncbi:MAG: ABC transporter permease subunit [Corynebacterium sp.]|nr:ABC transporter permease subunit [Corynebacterium sp.]
MKLSNITRLATIPVLLLLAVIAVASLPFIGNRDLAMMVLRSREAERAPDAETLEALRTELNLPSNAGEAIKQILTGNMGQSWVDSGRSAYEVAFSGFGSTLILAGSATLIAVAIAILIVIPRIRSIIRGRHSRTWHILPVAIIGSIPEFVLAVGIAIIFALHFGLIAATGLSIGPVLALAIPAGGLLGRVALISVDEVAQREWVHNWRVNSFPPAAIARAIIRETLSILVPQVAIFFVGLLASTVLVEKTFNIHGMGSAALTAALNQDLPVLQVITLFVLALGIIVGSIASLLKTDMTNGTASLRARALPRLRWGWIFLALPLLPLIYGYFRGSAAINAQNRLQSPSMEHWFGTDQLGRDILERIAHGFLYTVGAGVLVTVICVLISFLLSLSGTLSPYIERIAQAFNAIPAVLLGLLLAGMMSGSSLTAAMAVILVAWIPLTLHGIGVARAVRESAYYQWGLDHGESAISRLRNHVLPSLVPALVRHGGSRIAHNSLAIAGLGFLGVGAPHDSPEWGVILSESISYAERAPWMIIMPTVYLIWVGIIAACATDTSVK